MIKEHQQILELIASYLEEQPTQRFGQALFNLGINQFKDPNSEEYQLRDIYNDHDIEMIERIKERLKRYEEHKNNFL